MALVRVYCGLTSADPAAVTRAPNTDPALTFAVIDDTGRLLDVHELDDTPVGYAHLTRLLAERTTGPYSVAVATDDGDRLTCRLLATAGWALAVTETDTAEDFANRYVDALADGRDSAAQRRAIGIARALHAGVLSASLQPTPDDLSGLKPVLAAHGALATGRQAVATALREVLRELYPAALRAYPDPSDPVALAVMEALPEPGRLTASVPGRGRDAAAAADEVATQLVQAGLGDQATVTEAITALRVAIAETPRRGGVSRALTATVADAVRQSVAAVRACDSADAVLLEALSDRVAATAERSPAAPAGQPAHATQPEAGTTGYGRRSRTVERKPPDRSDADRSEPRPSDPDRGRSAPQPVRGGGLPLRRPAPQPIDARPTAPSPVAPPPVAPPPVGPTPGRRRSADAGRPVSAPAARVQSAPPAGRPVSAPPPPPPGIAPIAEPRPSRRQTVPRPPADPSRFSGDERQVPLPRRAPDGPPPGSRTDWPTSPPPDDWARDPLADQPGSAPAGAPAPGGRITPPWRAEDLRVPEAPLRLVEPTLSDELRAELGLGREDSDPRSLRLVEQNGFGAPLGDLTRGGPSLDPGRSLGTDSSLGGRLPHSAPPVAADAADDDLLIFAQTRSAWFSGEDSFESVMDLGWQAAEQAARPQVGDRTTAGLPRRVPHANLVPGSPPRPIERPLRIIRDPDAIKHHTANYFNGWRQGQVRQGQGGFALGGRQSRQTAGAWDFSRDEDREYGT